MKIRYFNFFFISLLTLCACESNIPSFSIHTEAQSSYLKDAYTNYSKYVNGQSENSKPEPCKIDLSEFKTSSIIKTFEEDNLIDTYTCDESLESFDLYNLKIGTNYKIEVSDGDHLKTYSFKTEDTAPRNLNIDGVTNCRDLGGWKISKKYRVKQGMIFRTAKFNDDESTDLLISENGISTIKNTLHIKTELDLRRSSDNENGGLTSSVLGSDTNYINIPMASAGNVMTLNKTKLSTIFDIFADESKYPIVFHCSIGTDRTGLIAFLLNGLLGVSEDDLYRDYLFSNFGLIYNMRTAKTIDEYLEAIKLSSGKTLSDQFASYLISTGVKSDTLNKIKNIMIEKK